MNDDHPMRSESATAFAPASIGNVAVGFDVLGCAVEGLGDRVTVRRVAEPGVRMGEIRGRVTDLPMEAEVNTAGAAVLSLVDRVGGDLGFEVSIKKGIPLGSGLGGSAASAVGAVVAAASLLPGTLEREELLPHALAGEAVASGARHPDNVVPILLGGLVLTRAVDSPDLISLPVPSRIRCVLVRPERTVQTRSARGVLSESVSLSDCTQQAAHLGAFVAGCYRNDLGLLRRSLRDLIVEPQRVELVPGFHEVQSAAMDAGALGCSLSGAGPTMFAWSVGAADAQAIRSAMEDAFARHNVETEAWITSIATQGARPVSSSAGE